ncbi:MAG: carboxylesterase family protein [Coriobacteriales bacterium]|nr:carboxylesterase family protein [Coriobacteriales bacterium]
MKTWECSAGTFCGFEEDGCIQLMGIRYAKSRRYDRPVPYVYPDGVHACVHPAPLGIQLSAAVEHMLYGVDYEAFAQEEECQYLSITLPKDVRAQERLPVMVWVHGGSYRNGGCDSPIYNRIPLVKENRVIVVALSYRLGALGFVRDREGGFGNCGLLDIIEGLRWVARNIGAFGGDPDKVTLFGQSAGADAVRCVMLAHGTEHLYRRAILQSDPMGAMVGRRKMEQWVLDKLCALPVDAPIEDVRAVQASIGSHVPQKGYARFLVFAPHMGVDPLPPESDVLARLAQVAPDHEVLVGYTTREAAAFLGKHRSVLALSRRALTRRVVEKVVDRASRKIFVEPAQEFAKAYARAGGRVGSYVLSWREKDCFFGACHMSDVPLLFGISGEEGQLCAMGLTKAQVLEAGVPLRRAWCEFARRGTVSNVHIDAPAQGYMFLLQFLNRREESVFS